MALELTSHNGYYKLNSDKSESFEPILLVMEVPYLVRKLANTLTPHHTLLFNNNVFTLTIASTLSTKVENYILDGNVYDLDHDKIGLSDSKAEIKDSNIIIIVNSKDGVYTSETIFKFLDNNSYEVHFNASKNGNFARCKRHFDRVIE